jgi:hypothetical protein
MTEIDLGKEDRVRKLFSSPPTYNAFVEPQLANQPLDQTVKHYVDSSLQRDGYSASTKFPKLNGRIVVQVEAPARYKQVLTEFLDAGDTAYRISERLKGDWRYNWRFFLPLGLAMTNHYTVQLMHFPPDYVLEKDQNYLGANTTEHWGALLQANGADSKELDKYQTIVDLAPISAPSGDGFRVQTVAVKYGDYANQLLRALLRRPEPESTRPMVAFGGAVHDWLKNQKVDYERETYGDGKDKFGCGFLNIPTGPRVKMLEANHPSRILFQHHQTTADPTISKRAKLSGLILIMHEDLIAAAWQVTMGKEPHRDPEEVLKECKGKWDISDDKKAEEIAALVTTHVLKKHAAQEGLPEPAPVSPDLVKQALDPSKPLRHDAEDLISRLSSKRKEENQRRTQRLQKLMEVRHQRGHAAHGY